MRAPPRYNSHVLGVFSRVRACRRAASYKPRPFMIIVSWYIAEIQATFSPWGLCDFFCRVDYLAQDLFFHLFFLLFWYWERGNLFFYLPLCLDVVFLSCHYHCLGVGHENLFPIFQLG